MPQIRFDTYYKYDDLTVILKELASGHKDLISLSSIGRSHEGRDIWVITMTQFASGADHEKPALWIDGNIHAAELAGSSACLYLIQTLLNGYGHQPDITRSLDTRVFYICPRINPDGVELALSVPPKLIRSSTRPYPYEDEPLEGLRPEDIDNDGRVLSMRIRDPDGHWKISPFEPRLLVPREPVETGGEYYRLLPEGMIKDYDGATIPLQRIKEGLDLNRNFPAKWRPEQEQQGAGPFPASEPEVRAVVEFIASHKNICGGVAFHTYSGVLLRPFSYKADEEFDSHDLAIFKKIADNGTRLTGYPAVSAYHGFRFDPQQVITGALDDWLYEDLGVYAWTVEIWSPQRQAGISDYHFTEWYQEHPFEDDLKLLKWSDTVLDGKGYIDWYEFDHPQLGKIELGGWDPLFSFWNPPPALLENELKRFPEWLIWHNLISPRIEFLETAAMQISEDTYRISALVTNSGWLPTYITKMGRNKNQSRGITCEIELTQSTRLVSGTTRIEIGQLEGRAHKSTSPFHWAGMTREPTDNRARAEWIISAKPGSTVVVKAYHEKAGTIRTQIRVG